MSSTGKSWLPAIQAWIKDNPRRDDETDDEWKARCAKALNYVPSTERVIRGHRATFVSHDEYQAIDRNARAQAILARLDEQKRVRRYERLNALSMLGRGVLASYILGIALSLGELNPRDWSWWAISCAASFLTVWVVAMVMERRA